MLTPVRVMAARVSGPFRAKTQIVLLRHEGSTTWVQCQLGFVGSINCACSAGGTVLLFLLASHLDRIHQYLCPVKILRSMQY